MITVHKCFKTSKLSKQHIFDKAQKCSISERLNRHAHGIYFNTFTKSQHPDFKILTSLAWIPLLGVFKQKIKK